MTCNVFGAPLFTDPATGSYTLRLLSPARDAGFSDPLAPAYDAAGMRRPFGGAYDLGAYEWHGPVFALPLLYRASAAP